MLREPTALRRRPALTRYLHRQPLGCDAVNSELYKRVQASATAAQITRYAIGWGIALGTGIFVFALLYVMIGNTTVCSIAAFVAGAVPNWVLNRRWAWKIRGEVG